jgi:hypothetical protein
VTVAVFAESTICVTLFADRFGWSLRALQMYST